MPSYFDDDNDLDYENENETKQNKNKLNSSKTIAMDKLEMRSERVSANRHPK